MGIKYNFVLLRKLYLDPVYKSYGSMLIVNHKVILDAV